MANKEKPPRVAVVVKTRDGRRLKPECPVCGEVSWGKLVPQGIDDPEKVGTMILAEVGEKIMGMGVQLWLCANCGHIWFRSGTVAESMDDER